MEVHIGQLIKEKLEKSGMKKSEFARRINKTSQNVYDIFERRSIDTALLGQIAAVLEFNFFETLAYQVVSQQETDDELKETAEKYANTRQLLRELNRKDRELSKRTFEINQLKKEIEYLKQINALLQQKPPLRN